MQGDSVTGPATGAAPLKRDSLQQQIYDRVFDGLVSGSYLPGQVLSTRGMAQELGVSAMPVREALTRLTAEGALELTSSRTLRVRVLTPEDFDEITAIRVNLEGMAGERAAQQVTEPDLDRVRTLHAELTTAAQGVETDRYLAANAAFHDGIYRAAQWPLLLSMIRRLWLTVGPAIRNSVPDHQHMATSMGYHDDALQALAARNAAGLRAAIVGDIETAAQGIRARLAEPPETPRPRTG
ncbi:GntR family transcriptional regulator [Pseudoponticoccus marisrubri]|uniref:GntR family transcriptional regulator n=1 Tax=Pseudoponticoccus marisrubri TaxID=1685382 RepID=A0A0W7WHJ1_9RHOB|nr:GntR family transcriptional regulator [Pseudoponticoccus marisrubri]KUF09972.1 GntR family transcriptional regulator [Pseudoponticoccus marisrubri]